MILVSNTPNSGSTPSVTEMSSTELEEESLSIASEVHVGLNDGTLSRRRRRLFELMNRLRSIGYGILFLVICPRVNFVQRTTGH